MKMYGFANFVEQHLVPYEYASISLVVIEASCGYYSRGFYCMTGIDKLRYLMMISTPRCSIILYNSKPRTHQPQAGARLVS